MQSEKHPINEEWSEYYQTLETIRRSGVVNMWGASPVLADWEEISEELATKVLLSWISNYDELARRYEWRK